MKKKLKISRLGLNVVLWVLPVLIIVFIAIGAFVITKQYSTSIDGAKDLVSQTSVSHANQIDGFLNQIVSGYSSYKSVIETADLSSEDSKFTLFKTTDSFTDSAIGALYLGSGKSNYYLDVSGYALSEPILKKDWYNEGISHSSAFIGTPYYDNTTKNFVFSVVSKISSKYFDSDSVLAGDFDLAALSKEIQLVSDDGIEKSLVINTADGLTLLDSNEEKLNTTLSQSDDSLYKEFANHTSSVTGNAFEINSDHNNYIVSMHNITSTNWTVITYANRKDILAANGYQHVKNILFLLFILALLVTSIIITIVITIKTNYLTVLNQNINTMANGDFRVDFHSERKDEIGDISNTLNHFLVSMRNMLEQLTSLSATLSNQITSSVSISQSVGDNTIMQTRSLKELSSTVTELANAINDIAEGATNLSASVNVTTKHSSTTIELMNTTIQKTAVGIDNMNTIKNSMEEISTIMNELVETVSTVKTSSDQISNITQLISDIAGQTNLLSLNASIEAARAGESGRGFAVVASEIGTLAETSNRSASEIDGLIKNIMGEIQATLDKTAQSVSKINASSSLVNNAYSVFSEINDSITESGHSVDSIIYEITDVNDVATNMAAATEEQSAMSEEIAATAESLNSQSDSIRSNATQLLSETDNLKNDVSNLMDLISKYKF